MHRLYILVVIGDDTCVCTKDRNMLGSWFQQGHFLLISTLLGIMLFGYRKRHLFQDKCRKDTSKTWGESGSLEDWGMWIIASGSGRWIWKLGQRGWQRKSGSKLIVETEECLLWLTVNAHLSNYISKIYLLYVFGLHLGFLVHRASNP